VLVASSNGGQPCGELIEYRECNTQACPEDCVLSEWSVWSECDAACGSGRQFRTREVLIASSNGGQPCGELIEYRECNTQPCDEECTTPLVILGLNTPLNPNPVNSLITVTALVNVTIVEAILTWGDGTETILKNPQSDFSATHVYSSAGVYSIELSVKDACGNAEIRHSDYIAIYDPDGGFVTGGGWIWSPQGALKSDPSLEGKANFGFVAKYRNGSQVPTGHTEFQFHAGNLRFNSSSYDAMRLIISGARAQFKGIGSINGSGNYGFMVSVVDGQVSGGGNLDKFRIKIWDIDNNDEIVYDNNVELSDENAVPITVISGGSIIIHKPKGNKSAEITDVEKFAIQELKMWPNPTTGMVHIDISGEKIQPVKVNVFNMAGTRVLQKEFQAGDNITFDMSEYISGMYLVRIETNDFETIKKLVLDRK
jgi:hypothetical protein